MRTLILVAVATMLSACASTHERTEMDRELALKLADRPQVIVANSPPPVVNVNNFNGGVSGAPSMPTERMPVGEGACQDVADYSIDGIKTGTHKSCVGWGH